MKKILISLLLIYILILTGCTSTPIRIVEGTYYSQNLLFEDFLKEYGDVYEENSDLRHPDIVTSGQFSSAICKLKEITKEEYDSAKGINVLQYYYDKDRYLRFELYLYSVELEEYQLIETSNFVSSIRRKFSYDAKAKIIIDGIEYEKDFYIWFYGQNKPLEEEDEIYDLMNAYDKPYSLTEHWAYCICRERTLKNHGVQVLAFDDVSRCIMCNSIVDLGTEVLSINSSKIQFATSNGSYILPNGVIVIVNADLQALYVGNLVFYKKNEDIM